MVDLSEWLLEQRRQWCQVVLVSPQGNEMKLAIQLHFQAPNNKAEYKALLIGLREARNVGVTQILVHLESQLFMQQVKRVFEITDEKLEKYCKGVAWDKEHFLEVVLK